MESDLMVLRQSPRASGARFFTALLGIALHSQTAVAQFQFYPPPVSLESLLQSPGPKWEQRRSAHFVLYTEQGISFPLAPEMLRDSLEEAWRHDTFLLHGSGIDQFSITVLVTHTPTRFPLVLAPSSRGVMKRDEMAGDVIILVHNESTRAFTRHEVMHVVSFRLWGSPGAPWVDEGLATFADGRCQATSVLAVARDLLRAEPGFAASDLDARYRTSAGPILGRRLRAYALAASMVAFVYAHGGPEAVRILRRDGIPPRKTLAAPDSLTAEWRNYVERGAAGQAGLSSDALDAHGCG